MLEDGDTPRKTFAGRAFKASVVLVAVFSLLPLADWIPGDPPSTLPAPHGSLYQLWVVSLVVLAAGAWVVVKLFPGPAAADKGSGKQGRAARRHRSKASVPPASGPRASGPSVTGEIAWRRWIPVALVVVPTLLYSTTAWVVFDGRPLHIDAMIQAFQANIYAAGHLSVPVPDDPRFFLADLVIEHDGRAFSQFPPGWSALLAVGFLLGIPWLIAPLCGALAVYGLYRLLKERGDDDRTALFTAVLLGLSPWFVFNAASWMSHVPALCFILLGSAALVRGVREPRGWLWAGLGGFGLGLATVIRPLEGVAFGLPATLWMLVRARSGKPALRGLAGFAVGGSLAIGLLLAYNQVLHGSPTLFGFELQWGPEHRLGFHDAPWGPPHTFLRGVQLVNGYLLGLQLLYFDAPAPSLVLALAALFLTRRLDAVDRYLLAGCTLLLLGYLAFWGEGHDLGPRYLIPLAPVVAIWTVRFGAVLADRTRHRAHGRWATALVVFLLVSGWGFGTRPRWFVYSQSDPLRRVDPTVLATPQAQNALVFLSSSWSDQVRARLRGTGMTPPEAQWFYRRVGLCKLDVALGQLEERNVTDPAQVVGALRPLASDSAAMVRDYVSGSPGDPFTGLTQADTAAVSLCALRRFLENNQGGYMLMPFQALLGPTWTGDGPIVARDLHEENRRLLQAYPERPAYYLRAVRIRGGIREFTLEPLKADSAERVWREFDLQRGEASIFEGSPIR